MKPVRKPLECKMRRRFVSILRLVFFSSSFILLYSSWFLRGQTAPPTLTFSMPPGAARGTTVTLNIDGINLSGADAIQFNESGLHGKITGVVDLPKEKPVVMPGNTGAVIEDHARRNKLTAEVTIADTMPPGRYSFRIRTPLGLTNAGALTVGAFPEVMEKEPNNSIRTAQEISFPITVVGAIAAPGDIDYFQFNTKAGQELVFEVSAASMGSSLDSILTLVDAQGRELARNDDYNGQADSMLGYRFQEAGRYAIRIADSMGGGSARHYYRLTMGELPYVTHIYPLGIPRQGGGEVTLEGFNLGDRRTVTVNAPAGSRAMESIALPFQPPTGALFNKPRLGLGDFPEIFEQEPNDDPARAQKIPIPVTINGRIHRENNGTAPDQDVYRFTAQKGQTLVFSVLAQRLGSPLDSVIEILDAKGQPVPRALVRCLYETYLNFRDADSQGGGMRLAAWNGLRANDYVMVGQELLQVDVLPKGPDEDLRFKTHRGRRLTYEDTTAEAHALNSPVYKVSVHRPDEKLPPNGMPVFRLMYRNDDGGPTHGKDSRLTFAAPESGDYFVRIKDVRDLQGRYFAYRLTVAEPRPDFTLMSSMANPNLAAGDAIPVTVTIDRKDGFDGPVQVQILDLPAGFSAASGVIPAGGYSVTLMLHAAADADTSVSGVAFHVQGTAVIGGREVAHFSEENERNRRVAPAPPPDLLVSLEPKQLEIEPGGSAEVKVTIRRANGFAGRVPLDVRNLPPGVIVPDVGLNGILINESESQRTFRIEADPKVPPFEQVVYVVGRVETTSNIPSEHGSIPVRLRVAPKSNGLAKTDAFKTVSGQGSGAKE